MIERVAVLGGGGFIGTNLCKYLLNKGVEVHAMSRSWLDTTDDPKLIRFTGDITDTKCVQSVIDGCDWVFHLAHGYTPASSMERLGDELVGSVLPTLELMKFCSLNESKLIFISSGGTVYGPAASYPTHEDTLCAPITGYGVSKLALEQYLNVFKRHHGLEYRILRLSNPYGTWQFGRHGQGVVGAWLERVLKGQTIEIWGDGTIVRDYVYIDDVVEAMWQAGLYDGPHHVFNIGSGTGRSLNEILEILTRLNGRELVSIYRPSRASDVPVSILDISRAAEHLDWRPRTGFAEGLTQAYQWMQQHAREGT